MNRGNVFGINGKIETECLTVVGAQYAPIGYLIMGRFFYIAEKSFTPSLQATGQCSQNVPPAGCLHQPVAGSCF